MSVLEGILPIHIIKEAVEGALKEDLGRAGDITTNSIVPQAKEVTCVFNARKAGVIAGLGFAECAFRTLSEDVEFVSHISDGCEVSPEEAIATVTAPARTILTGERVALNFLSHLSGIASLTHDYVNQVSGTSARICCTRKTTPGLRAFEKYAVRAGGGVNHRFGLDDAVMIKDNHIAIVGSISEAVARVRQSIGHTVSVEVEVDTLGQLEEVLTCDVDIVLLDNMSASQLREAVKMVNGRLKTEASGGVTLETVRKIAETGVDLISVGALTHSAPILDIGLDFSVLTK